MRSVFVILLSALLLLANLPILAASLQEVRELAEQGDAESQFELGTRYMSGKGLERDPGEAVKWYRKAAEQGYSKAQTNLAHLYMTGRGVAQDYVEAMEWFRRAAGQGDTKAQMSIGMMYLT
ncbi:MAG: tetratricopeptide repeat protein, partial [Gammaproteobacteria bacterium]|nr:tetratricopeptide repeat protein [Gammaproteobacteria bacterium]